MQADAQLEGKANQAAQGLMGEVAWPTVIYGLTVSTGYFATIALAAMGSIPSSIAFVLVVIFTYGNYTVVHDAVHKSINGSNDSLRWLNELLGHLCALPYMSSFLAHRREHFAHHRNTNIPGKDPDLPMAANGFASMIKTLLISPVSKVIYYFEHFAESADRKEKIIVLMEVSFGFAWRIAFAVLVDWKLALLLFVGGMLVGVFILQSLFAWIVHRAFERSGRYHDTSTIVFPGWLDTPMTLIWLFQNYHAVHHLFPRVPFYRYRQLFREIEDVMQAKGAPIYRVGDRTEKSKLPSLNPV